MEEYEKLYCHETDRCHHQQPERKQVGKFAATFEEAGKKSSSNVQFKFWEHENHPILLETTEVYDNCL